MSDSPDDSQDCGPGLLVHPAFWVCAAVCVMFWGAVWGAVAKATE